MFSIPAVIIKVFSFSFYCSLSRIQQEVPSKAVLEQEMVWMKEHLSSLGSPVVLCHNDLLCKNIIHNSKEGDTQFSQDSLSQQSRRFQWFQWFL